MSEGDGLKTDADRKKAAVKALEEDLEPGTKTAGAWADESTEAAVKEFKGWDTALGLADALKEWGEQVKALRNRLAAEKVAHSTTNWNLLGVDQDNGMLFGPFAPSNPTLTYPPSTSKITGL